MPCANPATTRKNGCSTSCYLSKELAFYYMHQSTTAYAYDILQRHLCIKICIQIIYRYFLDEQRALCESLKTDHAERIRICITQCVAVRTKILLKPRTALRIVLHRFLDCFDSLLCISHAVVFTGDVHVFITTISI